MKVICVPWLIQKRTYEKHGLRIIKFRKRFWQWVLHARSEQRASQAQGIFSVAKMSFVLSHNESEIFGLIIIENVYSE